MFSNISKHSSATVGLFLIIGFTPVNKIHTPAQSTEWELSKDNNDIKVYTRQYEGSKIKEFMAVTTVTAKMESLEALIDNVSDYPNWQANLETAKILKQVNQNEQYIYYTTDVPWPITDRDIVVHSKKTVNKKGTVTYTISSSPDYIKENDDFMRVRDAKGKWQFIPQKDGKIMVIDQFYANPAGSIPNWIINLFIVDGPYKTLTNLKKVVEQEKQNKP